MARVRSGHRLHIGIFGRRNVGKSSLLNALTRQQASIVSEVAGTTTDPVEKPMELQPLGPVLFIDTAGIDDEGALGGQRIARTRQVLDRADLGLIVCDQPRWGDFERHLLQELRLRGVPVVAVFSKVDLGQPDGGECCRLEAEGLRVARCALTPEGADGRGLDPGMADLRQALLDRAPMEGVGRRSLLADLVPSGSAVVLVVPVDEGAPVGRLILPQQQVITDLLAIDARAVVVKDTGLKEALAGLSRPPALVVTDSQAFRQVARDTPPELPMTSFSILFARRQGDLAEMARGAAAIRKLVPGDGVLIAEACTHHPGKEDIGRVKLPAWLAEQAGGPLRVDHVQGHEFPSDPSPWKLVVQCGACMWNRREVLSRQLHCRQAGVPLTNYGVCIAATMGILDRALAPFPEALAAWRESQA
jgi:[FeFe] hydrogenase H-cluster maturation GTPase HydF